MKKKIKNAVSETLYLDAHAHMYIQVHTYIYIYILIYIHIHIYNVYCYLTPNIIKIYKILVKFPGTHAKIKLLHYKYII